MAESHADYMARRKAELASGKSTYGSGTVQQTSPTATFQPAINVQNQSPLGDVPYAQAPQPSGPTAQQIAAQQEAARVAQEEAQKGALRGGISSLIDQALGVYDTLYGNVRGAAQSQRQALEGRYAKETGALTDQFNVELPKIGRSFAGRGAYDSSYRIEGEQEAGRQFQNQLSDLGTQQEADQAKIGAELAGQEAELGTGKGLLELTRSRLGEVTDLNELQTLQSEIQRKIVELQGTAQSTGSQAQYLSKFGEIAPSADRLPQLQATLTNIINGQAPGALKRAVAQQIIGSAGLPQEDKDRLTAQVNAQIVG